MQSVSYWLHVINRGKDMYLLLDIKKIYSNRLVKMMLLFLIVLAVLDPISTYTICSSQSGFAEVVGTNAFQFWLLMNSSGRGHAIYFALFFVFPIISTGFIFFYERRGILFEAIISKVSRKKYFTSKLAAVFIVTFVNFFVVLLMNLLVTYMLFDTNTVTEQYFYSVPQSGTFAETFYKISPFAMGVMYSFLNAILLGILAMWSLSIHMIGKFKKIYTAFGIPLLISYITEYIVNLLGNYYEINGYNPLTFIQPRAASGLVFCITGRHVITSLVIMLIMAIVLFIFGIKRNEDVL